MPRVPNMDRHSPSLGTAAPYGHACANCAQSKCKCIIRKVGGPCERCYRSNRTCRPAETVRRRNPRRPAASKTAQIEEKLDGLMSLIKAGVQYNAVNISPETAAPMDDSEPYSGVRRHPKPPTRNQSERGSVSSSSIDHTNTALASNLVATGSVASSYHTPISEGSGEPSPAEAEEYLINFQTHKLKYFPCIHISSTTTAQQLRLERPFLWLCIMRLGSKSTSQQQLLGNTIRQTIAQEMAVRSEKNIDLLLGLLTFIGWANYQIPGKPFLSLFTQLAMSLIFDLGLNNPAPTEIQVMLCMPKCVRYPSPRTMEERRAVVSCFLITSIISSFLQKIDALRWTPHMDECLQVLDEAKECPNDEILVRQVRLQLIIERMSLFTSHDGAMKYMEHERYPSLYLQSLHSQLQVLKVDFLTRFQSHQMVLLHLFSTELDAVLPPMFHTNQLAFQSPKSLSAVLGSIKCWFDVFFTIPPAGYIGFTFPIFTQLIRCLTMLHRLTTLDDLTWDEQGVRNTANPYHIVDRLIGNLEQVPILAGLDSSEPPLEDVFSRAAQLLRSIQSCWEAKISPADFVLQQNVSEVPLSDDLGVEFFDNDWLMDLLVSPDY